MSEMTQGYAATDVALSADEPELELPVTRPIPVEMVNITQPVPAQNLSAQAFNINYGDSPAQILNADPLRSSAQITAYGDGQIWLCHSRSAADMVAALLDANQGVSEIGTVAVNNPAAGGPGTYVLPNNAKLLAAVFNYNADATAGTRYTTFSIADQNGNIVAQVNPSSGIVAGASVQAHLAVGAPSGLSATGGSFQGLPSLPELPAGWQIIIGSSFYGPGDQISGYRLTFQEGANAGPITDEAPGFPLSSGTVVPVTATAPVWAVATTDNMIVGVIQERRQ